MYALFLAVVLSAAAALRQLDIGWFGTWLLQIAFWWGVLIKRHELIGFVSVKARGERSGGGIGSLLGRGYHAVQLGRVAARTTHRAAQAPARASAAVATHRTREREARTVALGQVAKEHLEADGRRALERDQTVAAKTLGERRQIDRELRAVDRRLAGFDEAHVAARAADEQAPAPTPEQALLLERRKHLLALRDRPAMHAANQVMLHADRTRAQTGASIAPRDLEAYRLQRAADLRAGLPVDHEQNLRAAGIDPEHYARAEGPQRTALLGQTRAHLERERALLAASESDAGARPDVSAGLVHLDPVEYRRRVAAERERIRRERQARRATRGVVRR